MSGTTGGFKEVRNQDSAGSYRTITFSGQKGSLQAYVVFDLNPPFHCSEDPTTYPCELDELHPMMFERDIIKVNISDFSFAFQLLNDDSTPTDKTIVYSPSRNIC